MGDRFSSPRRWRFERRFHHGPRLSGEHDRMVWRSTPGYRGGWTTDVHADVLQHGSHHAWDDWHRHDRIRHAARRLACTGDYGWHLWHGAIEMGTGHEQW